MKKKFQHKPQLNKYETIEPTLLSFGLCSTAAPASSNRRSLRPPLRTKDSFSFFSFGHILWRQKSLKNGSNLFFLFLSLFLSSFTSFAAFVPCSDLNQKKWLSRQKKDSSRIRMAPSIAGAGSISTLSQCYCHRNNFGGYGSVTPVAQTFTTFNVEGPEHIKESGSCGSLAKCSCLL